MVAPNYAAARSALAKSMGLGRKANVAQKPVSKRRPPRLDLDIYPYLPRATVEKTSAKAYMRLLDREEEPA